MEICSGGRKTRHEEIVFVVTPCPLCGVMEELEDARTTIKSLEDELEEAKNEHT